MVEDWVNVQDEELKQHTNATKPGSVCKNDEILWSEFKASFKAAWTDTTKVQSAYSQLMDLKMKDLNVDTYNTMFACLANTAGWETDAKGTIDRYRSGLWEAIQHRVINCDKMPESMDKWQTAARREVTKIKELQSSGLTRPHQNQVSHDGHTYQNTSQHANSNQNNEHIPMDVDSVNMITNFKKLTDEEQAKYHAEGRCFWCRIQGHMARNCLKNVNTQNTTNCPNTNVRMASTMIGAPPTPSTASSAPPPAPSTPPPPLPKLSCTQQIHVLEEQMEDEERSNYLNARDMGEDFCTAGL
jgi:hypothetical protein